METFKEALKRECNKSGIELNEKAIDKLNQYKELLLEWNEKMNLTAITEENDIIHKHFIDSLAIAKYIKKDDSVIDIGTGAGFPGIPIAIYFNSEIKLTLVDGLNKRLIFLEEVVNKLELKNINIIHARAEELGRDTFHREKYDVVVSRAVASLNILSEYNMPFVKLNGIAIFMKGSNIDEELETAKSAILKLSGHIEEVDRYIIQENIEHCNIIIRKIKKISELYPRHGSKIKKSPL